jgi:hypothetical protein
MGAGRRSKQVVRKIPQSAAQGRGGNDLLPVAGRSTAAAAFGSRSIEMARYPDERGHCGRAGTTKWVAYHGVVIA